MKRVLAIILATLALLALITGCQRTVEVQTGTRIECTYGHTISDDVETVEVPAKTAAAYRVRTERRTCDTHLKLETLYREAQEAIAKGDLETAEAKLKQIQAEEKDFRNTADQLDAIAKGEKPAPDTSEPGQSTPTTVTPKPGEGDTSGPIGSLKKYTPDTLDGYVAGRPMTDALSIAREYVPEGRSKARSLVIVAEQFRTSDEAKRMLGAQMDGYANDTATQRVNGRSVRFGTDGRLFATAGFTEGAVLVVLEMPARDGEKPSELKGAILEALGQLK